jgi:hypothetical protein
MEILMDHIYTSIVTIDFVFQINEKAEITVERDTLKHRNTIVEEMLEEKDGVEMDKNEWR